MERGTIVRLVPNQGIGYLRTAAGQEVFFHWTAIRDLDFCSLRPGMEVLVGARTQRGVGVAMEVRCPVTEGGERPPWPEGQEMGGDLELS
jgi:cold shock CspA family protein